MWKSLSAVVILFVAIVTVAMTVTRCGPKGFLQGLLFDKVPSAPRMPETM
jgi:hypothetical protein